jgi:oligoribonuclease NrnB/cAMP/cGMP phosphodiesterase (DHH superfamily)
MKKFCIYHGNCSDGFGAAWVVRKALGKDNVLFHPGVYQTDPPEVRGQEIVMVDFSYKRPVLLRMAERAKSILIIDHHKTAAEDLVDLPNNVKTVFDMDHSGAILTWQHYFGKQPPPQLLQHIEDRDLWRFKLDKTREIQAALFSHPYDFALWDVLFMQPGGVALLAKDGEAIERKHFKDIQELIAGFAHKLTIQGYTVPALNAPYFYSSDAGHILAKDQPFAVCYWYGEDGVTFSLRSTGDVDVSEIATRYGGGGHPKAAGFKLRSMADL